MSEHKAKDWARNCCSPQFLIAWGIPISALVLSSSTGIGLAWIWPIGLAWLGIACLLNARRCSRTHCLVTGPFFLALAAVAALYGSGIIDLGPDGWHYIANTTFIGGLILCCLPDLVFGRYRRREG